jgi:hypothetical protein
LWSKVCFFRAEGDFFLGLMTLSGNLTVLSARAPSRPLETGAMKSITPDPFVQPFIWTRINGGGFRQSAMKTRIENGKLWNAIANKCTNNLYSFGVGMIVQRRKSGKFFYRSLDFRITRTASGNSAPP